MGTGLVGYGLCVAYGSTSSWVRPTDRLGRWPMDRFVGYGLYVDKAGGLWVCV